MSFKYLIYFIMIYVCLMSLVTLVYSIVNKNKFVSKLLLFFSIIYIVHFLYFLLIDVWRVPTGFELIFIFILAIGAFVIYIISIIVDIVKIIKSKINFVSIKHVIFMISLILLPTIILFSCFFVEKVRLANSDFIVVYESDGNGGFADSDTFAYAITDDKCFKFDLGIQLGGSYLKKFLPDKFEEFEFHSYDEKDFVVGSYTVPLYDYNESEEDLFIYKDGKEVCKIDTDMYFNIELQTSYK